MLKIKSKIFAGLMVALFVLGAVAVNTASAATWAPSSATLIRKGSSAANVMWLQATLNATQGTTLAVDGMYGPKTTAAIVAFQKAHPSSGVADGIAGPKTIAALNAAGANGGSVSSVPGCTSTTGFSPTTGASCGSAVVTTPATGLPAGCVTASGFSPTTGASCATGVMTSSGPLTAMLSSDNPAAGYVISNQATADLAHFTFTGTGVLNSVTLSRTGISDQNTLSNVYLYNGTTRLTDGYSFNNSGVLTMNNLGINVNGSMNISVKADISSTAGTTASTVGVALTGFTAGSAASTVNIAGNMMYVGTGSPASVYLATQASVAVPNASVNAGTSAYTVWSAPVQVNTRAVFLKGANFRMVGSAPVGALANIKLYVDGVATGNAATVTAINGSNYAMFDFSGSPVSLTTGSHTVDVRADVVSGSSYTVQVSLQQAADLVLFDPQLGINIAPAVSSTAAFTSNNAGTITINAGSASVVIDPAFSAMTNVTGGATNVDIAKFKVHGYGEDVKVSSLSVTPVLGTMTPSTTTLNNVALYFNGSQVGSSQNWTGTGALTFNLGSQMIIPAAVDSTIEVKADLQNASSVNYTAGTVSATLNLGSLNAQGQTSHTTLNFPGSSVAGTSLTVQTGLLAVSSNGAYANQIVSPNASAVKIGSFVLQNQSSSEAVNVTGLNIALAFAAPTFTSGTVTTGSQAITVSSSAGFTVGNIITIPGATPAVGTVAAITDSTHVQVNITTGGVTPTVGGAITGGTIGSTTTTAPATLTNFSGLMTSETSGSGATPVQPTASNTFSVNFTLAPGATKTIDVFANTSTANFGAITTTLTVTSLGANSHVSITQTGAGTGQTITLASGTINTTPTLLTASATTSQFVSAANGAVNATKATYNFAATGGTATITELKFSATAANTITSVSVNGQSAPVVAGVADITGLSLAVPNGSSGLNQDVLVTYPVIGTNGLPSGTTSVLTLTSVKYTSGGATTTFTPSIAAPTMTLVGSKPTLSAVKPTALVATGNVEAIDVTVAADAAGNIALNTLPLTVTPSSTATMGVTANTIIVKDANNTTVATTNTAFGTSAGGATTITFTGGYTIQAGQSQTFKIFVPVASTTPSGVNSVSLSTALATGSGFSWTDIAGGGSTPITGTTLIPSYPSTFTSVLYN